MTSYMIYFFKQYLIKRMLVFIDIAHYAHSYIYIMLRTYYTEYSETCLKTHLLSVWKFYFILGKHNAFIRITHVINRTFILNADKFCFRQVSLYLFNKHNKSQTKCTTITNQIFLIININICFYNLHR